MPYQCQKCKKEVLWLKHKDTNKPAPIEAEPSENGNIFVHGKLYRLATAEEIIKAKEIGKPLYLNHFASCEFAREFSKKKPKAAAAKPECVNCGLPLNVYEKAEFCPLGCKQDR